MEINRTFPDEEIGSVHLFGERSSMDFDIMIYVENLGARIRGFVEYIETDKDSDADQVKKLPIHDFYLDLAEKEELIKNHTFKVFWEKFDSLSKQEDISIQQI